MQTKLEAATTRFDALAQDLQRQNDALRGSQPLAVDGGSRGAGAPGDADGNEQWLWQSLQAAQVRRYRTAVVRREAVG
jgi:hypothetical protein